MKCKGLNRQCALESMHKGKCVRLAINNDGRVRLTNGNDDIRGDAQNASGVVPKGVAQLAEPESRGGAGVECYRTPNRRTREAYNRYMREYMRRKRSGFIGIAYG
jgi:hypothetical protein